jgi:5-methylcytosine-specific restriction endonuclease McrA
MGQVRRTPVRPREEVRHDHRRSSRPAHAPLRQDSARARPPGLPAMMKPCLDCGTPSDGSRCLQHAAKHNGEMNRRAQIKRASNGGHPYDRGTYRTQASIVRATATRCHICGEGPRVNDPWQADHVIPISKGGEYGPLAPAHRSCNISRANKLRAGKPDLATRTPKRNSRGRVPTHHQPNSTLTATPPQRQTTSDEQTTL